jgi:hypothetical protein
VDGWAIGGLKKRARASIESIYDFASPLDDFPEIE